MTSPARMSTSESAPTPVSAAAMPAADHADHAALGLSRGLPAVLFPNTYAWFVLVATLDLVVTNTVINYLGAREVNALAQWIIDHFNWWGLIGFKFLTVILVVGICEHIGRRKPRLGGAIARIAVMISAFPVIAAAAQIVLVLGGLLQPIATIDPYQPAPRAASPFRVVTDDGESYLAIPSNVSASIIATTFEPPTPVEPSRSDAVRSDS